VRDGGAVSERIDAIEQAGQPMPQRHGSLLVTGS
jgi:hypothetical protein